jgi:hypothetical protein
MAYYPEQTLILGMTTIRRERKLPPNAVGEVMVEEGAMIDQPSAIVLRGAIPGEFILLDALKPLGLRSADEITDEMLAAQPGEVIDPGQAILTLGKGRGAKSVLAPVQAIFARLDRDRVILQANPVPFEVQALITGQVTSVRGETSVLIETPGTLIQGAWGNGKTAYAPLSLEPEGGIESLHGDTLLQNVAGTAMVIAHSIGAPNVFAAAAQQGIAAVIAPSMSSGLREFALRQTIPIILTEGFGDMQMSEIVYNLLRGNANRAATIDATEPTRWSPERPEIAIPLASGGARPPAPETNQPLYEGSLVRVTRRPLLGMTGKIRRVPDAPRAVENGLRLAVAEVQLTTGKLVSVPLANLELLGRPLDAPGKV